MEKRMKRRERIKKMRTKAGRISGVMPSGLDP